MAIKRVGGNVVFECDECGEEIYTETDDFDEARDVAYEDGWRNRKDSDDEWINLCGDCA